MPDVEGLGVEGAFGSLGRILIEIAFRSSERE